jgi:hypothetical protein
MPANHFRSIIFGRGQSLFGLPLYGETPILTWKDPPFEQR